MKSSNKQVQPYDRVDLGDPLSREPGRFMPRAAAFGTRRNNKRIPLKDYILDFEPCDRNRRYLHSQSQQDLLSIVLLFIARREQRTLQCLLIQDLLLSRLRDADPSNTSCANQYSIQRIAERSITTITVLGDNRRKESKCAEDPSIEGDCVGAGEYDLVNKQYTNLPIS